MRALILTLFLLVAASSIAQQNEKYYIFNANWEPIQNVGNAKFFIHFQKINDTCYQWDYYNFVGPRIKTESYRDPEAKIPNGFFAYYSNQGYLDSCGYVFNWSKDQYWTYFRGDSGRVYMRKTYDHGKLLKIEDYGDGSSNNEGELEEETFANVQLESEFTGGPQSWQAFLNKNLKYPKRALDSEVQGTVSVLFVVDTKGKVTEPVVAKSVEISLDQEALRIIVMSPGWNPAFQNGKNVKSYKQQPIIFRLDD